MKKTNILLPILLIISIMLVIQGCISNSQAADPEKKEIAIKWSGETKIKPENAYYYDDLGNGGSSENKSSYENGIFILKGKVTTQYQYGFIGGGLEVNSDIKELLLAAKGIKFKIKGDGKSYRCRLESKKVKDFDHFGFIFKTTEEETEITILYANLSQEGWGKSVTFDQIDVFQISFQTVGQPHDSVYLEVYDMEIIPAM